MAKTKKKIVKSSHPWFKRKGKVFNRHVPINWKGYTTLIVFLAFNFLSVLYFNFPFGSSDSIFAFLSVFCLSVFVFSVVLIKKTRGEENKI